MYKILILALREYKTAIRTKAFIIGLVITPIFMGGSLFVMAFFQDRVDVDSKEIVVIDHTNMLSSALVEAAEYHNKHEVFDSARGKKTKPEYNLEVVAPDSSDLLAQRLALSERVKNKQLHAFVEIGPDVVFPKNDPEKAKVKYYSENSFMDDIRGWMNWPLNNKIRQLRIAELGLDQQEVKNMFDWVEVSGMGLLTAESIGQGDNDAKESNPIETILIPYVFLMLIFMMIIMSAVPLLTSVMEEKTERIAEVLLGSVTPFQFMMGKVIGSLSVSLTGALIYVVGGILVVNQLDYSSYVPFDLLPWFFVYMLLSVVMFGSIMAALGSACNDSKDAQALQFPAMLPIILPMFVMMPVLREPLGSFATGLSLFPPFTPMLMLVRQATPVSIPMWQPIVGLIGVVLFTILSIWLGSKIFRTMILIQGKKPNLINIIKTAFSKG
ncbi:MAG: ABC transporter permease [Bacteroidales bacterium]|nr:ABC transporter permease [Bacteroidales bacterium]MBN2820759.1 ABC transporter permease [Bacteroidales bacterium]